MVKKAFALILCAVIIFVGVPVSANGGPGECQDLFIGGNVKFVNTPDIIVQQEDLNIKVMPKESEVTAKYILKNNGKARDISYYFPISRYVDYSEETGGSLKWINFYDGSKKLEFTKTNTKQDNKKTVTDSDGNTRNAPINLGGIDINYQYVENTFYNTKLSFAAGETKTLTVIYRASNNFWSGGTSKVLLMHYSDVIFLYDLRPAAAWGNGKAGVFNLTMDYSGLKDVLDKDLSLNIPGFKRDDSGKLNYTQNNYDYKKQGFIAMKFNYPFHAEQLKQFNMGSDMLDGIYVSSTLNNDTKNYGVANLFDKNLNTVWATNQNKGIGTQLILSLENAMNGNIGIVNGNIKSESLYYDNERIKKMRVEVYDDSTQQFQDRAWVGDWEFPDIPYKSINKNNIFTHLDLFEVDASLVRLTVLEVYPGRKSNDLCIGEMYFFAGGDVSVDASQFAKGYDIFTDSSKLIDIYKQANGIPIDSSEVSSEDLSSEVSRDTVSVSSLEPEATGDFGAVWIALGDVLLLLIFVFAGGVVVNVLMKKRHES